MKKSSVNFALLSMATFCALLVSACKSEVYTKGLSFVKGDGYYTVFVGTSTNNTLDIIIPTIYKSTPVKAVGRCAFFGQDIISVTIPDSIECIDDMAFAYCDKLIDVKMGKNVIKIVGGAFACCSSLPSIIIPDGVSAIELNTFYDCTSLTSITIGKGISAIDEGAFYNCINLTDVYYQSYKSDWDKITIDLTNNDCLLNATIHFID